MDFLGKFTVSLEGHQLFSCSVMFSSKFVVTCAENRLTNKHFKCKNVFNRDFSIVKISMEGRSLFSRKILEV